ncbi:UNVERIFIED_CONTAM: GTP-binding protein Rho1, partial [Siphonaria sp. JEL0065]
ASIILVGLKEDLRNDPVVKQDLSKEQQTPIMFEEGQQVAKRICAFKYIECSSKTGTGLQAVLKLLALAMPYSLWASKNLEEKDQVLEILCYSLFLEQ